MEARLGQIGILALLIALAAAAFGQATPQDGLRLTVTDEQDRAVAGAKCVLSKNAKSIAEIQTGPDGTAVFSDIPVGSYDLRVEKDGFRKYERVAISFSGGKTSEITV